MLHRVVSLKRGDTSPSWSQPAALGEQQRWRRTHPIPSSLSRSGSWQGAQGGSHSAERNGTQPKHQTFELVWKSQVVVVPPGCTINTKPKPDAELSREKVFKSNPFRRGFLGPCRTQYLSHLHSHLKHGLKLWNASTFSAFSGKKKLYKKIIKDGVKEETWATDPSNLTLCLSVYFEKPKAPFPSPYLSVINQSHSQGRYITCGLRFTAVGMKKDCRSCLPAYQTENKEKCASVAE